MDRPSDQDDRAAEAAVTVWWAWCSQSRPIDLASLSGDERTRVDGLHLGADRERSALARVVLRRALAPRLAQPAETIELAWENGPSLDPRHGLWASVAHSQDGVVAAISSVGPVGVDVEAFSRAGELHRQVRERVFTVRERDYLASLPDDVRDHSAVELWTVKEAVLKAAGERFTHPAASVEVERNGGPPRLVGFEERRDLIEGARLSVVGPPAGGAQEYVSTVAILGVADLAPLQVDSRDAAELFG